MITYRLSKSEELPEESLHPSVIAEKNGKIIGRINTYIKNGLIIASLDMNEGKVKFILIKLVYIYHAALREIGITGYRFYTKPDSKLKSIVDKISIAQCEKEGEYIWYYVDLLKTGNASWADHRKYLPRKSHLNNLH